MPLKRRYRGSHEGDSGQSAEVDEMKKIRALVLVPAVLFAVACGRDDSTKSVDAALDSDLRLAGEAYAPGMDSISMMERNAALAPTTPAVTRTATAPRRTTTAPRRTTTTRRASSSGSSSGSVSTRATVRTETRRNTARDAAIGATAGAVIGATTSKDKVKGGLIGAAIGGIAGAVIGHNVDKKTVPVNDP